MSFKIQLKPKNSSHVYWTEIPDREVLYGGYSYPFGMTLYTDMARVGMPAIHKVIFGFLIGTITLLVHEAISIWYILNHIQEFSIIPLLVSSLSMTLMVRLTPWASIHASEHQVIAALEAGVELTHENVSSQPRVHKRCGTNRMTGIMMFMIGMEVLSYTQLPGLVNFAISVIVGYAAKNHLGGLVQYYLTTKPARAKDIDKAIEIAYELNQKHFTKFITSDNRPSLYIDLLNSIRQSDMLNQLLGLIIAFAYRMLFV